jgi:hypothetical protein
MYVHARFFCAIPYEAQLVFALAFPDDTQTAPNLFCDQIYFNRGGSYETTALLDHMECDTAGL